MARFLNGLNKNIMNLVELQQYRDMDELRELAIKVERQLKSSRPPQGVRATQPLPPWQRNKPGEFKKGGGFTPSNSSGGSG